MFYRNDEPADFYIELCSYINKYYFKSVRNDAHILLFRIICEEFNEIILELNKKGNYYVIMELYKNFFDHSEKFLKSKFISNTFLKIEYNGKDIKNMDYYSDYIIRNLFLFETLKESCELLMENTNIFDNEHCLKNDIDDINDYVNRIKKSLDTIKNHII